MSSSAYYAQAIERALGLLRQGQTEQAKNLLQGALDLNLKMLPSDMVQEPDLELDIPEPSQLPHYWIEGNDLRINDDGWNIDREFTEELASCVDTNIVLGMSTQDILLYVHVFLEAGIKQGRVRRRR